MDEFEDFWSSEDLKDDGLPSDEEVLEQERVGARRDREWLLKQFKIYGSLADKLTDIVTESPLEDEQKEELLSSLMKVRFRLMQEPVRLLVLGASSAGKSTLVNALTGRIVSPEAQHSSTLIPAWIRSVDKDLGGEVAYNIMKRDMTKKYMARPAYLKMYCHPPEDKNSNPDDYAVIADVEGGFLAESGLMLLDTPGVDQTDADTDMTVRTADLGAEMVLMIIRSNVFSEQETVLYKKLFPDGEMDLGLDVPSDVFAVYNVMPGNPDPPSNVVDSIREMTDGRLNTNARLYSIDVLRERQRCEPYRYYDWAPNDISDPEEIQKLKKDQSREKHGYTVGASQRPYGYELLKDTPPGPEMTQLTNALRRRAWALYADRQRICAPILASLRGVADSLANEMTAQIAGIYEQTEQEAAAMTADELRTGSPQLDGLLEKMTEAQWLVKEVQEEQAALLSNVDNVMEELEKAGNDLRSAVTKKGLPSADGLFDGIDLSADPVVILPDICSHIQSLSLQWQDRLKKWLLALEDDQDVSYCIYSKLVDLGHQYNSLADKMLRHIPHSAARQLDAYETPSQLMKQYNMAISSCLTPQEDIQEALHTFEESILTESGSANEKENGPHPKTLAGRLSVWIISWLPDNTLRQKAKDALLAINWQDLRACCEGMSAFAQAVADSDYITTMRRSPFMEELNDHLAKLQSQIDRAVQTARNKIIVDRRMERSLSQQMAVNDVNSLSLKIDDLEKLLGSEERGKVSHSRT